MARIALLMTLLLSPSAAGTEDRDVLARAVAAAYDDNRAKFPFGSFQIDLWEGQAPDAASARSGKFSKSVRTQGELVFIPENARYTSVFSDDDFEAAISRPSERQTTSTLMSFRALTNGKLSLMDRVTPTSKPSRTGRTVMIEAGPEEFIRFAKFPLALGSPEAGRNDFSRNVLAALDGKTGWALESVEDHVTYETREVVRLALRTPTGKVAFWVDLERGGIPLKERFETEDGKFASETYRDDVRLVEGHGWLPYAQTLFDPGSGGTKRLVILASNLETKIDVSMFLLSFPTPVQVYDRATNRVYKAAKTIDLNHLPGPDSPDSVPVSASPPADQPGEIEASRSPAWLLAGLAMIGLGAVAVWWLSRKK